MLTREQFEKEFLECHNKLRANHNSPPLALDGELSNFAQEWADYLAAADVLEHRRGAPYGENLFMTVGEYVCATEPIEHWYDRIDQYDMNQECSYLINTVPFNNLVWPETTRLGVGVARNGNGIYVVAYYDPPAKWLPYFDYNDHLIPKPPHKEGEEEPPKPEQCPYNEEPTIDEFCERPPKKHNANDEEGTKNGSKRDVASSSKDETKKRSKEDLAVTSTDETKKPKQEVSSGSKDRTKKRSKQEFSTNSKEGTKMPSKQEVSTNSREGTKMPSKQEVASSSKEETNVENA